MTRHPGGFAWLPESQRIQRLQAEVEAELLQTPIGLCLSFPGTSPGPREGGQMRSGDEASTARRPLPSWPHTTDLVPPGCSEQPRGRGSPPWTLRGLHWGHPCPSLP